MTMRALFAGLVLAVSTFAAEAQPLPPPIIKYHGQSPPFGLIYVYFGAANWSAYNPVFFTPAPQLPPCGNNPGSSRAWIQIYNAQTNKYIYGFCSLTAPIQFERIWFATPASLKPKFVYVIIRDRLTNRAAKSNVMQVP